MGMLLVVMLEGDCKIACDCILRPAALTMVAESEGDPLATHRSL